MLVNQTQKVFPTTADKSILVVEDNFSVKRLMKIKLERAKLGRVDRVNDMNSAIAFLEKNNCDLLFVDISFGDNKGDDGLFLLEWLRFKGYRKTIVLLADAPSQSLVLRAVMAGADDFLVKSLFLDIVKEASRLLKYTWSTDNSVDNQNVLQEKGFLRSMGLSKSDIALLTAYSNGFPRYTELAEQLGRPQVQIRKRFSDIYRKIPECLGIENPAQLASLLTILLMNQR